TKHATARTSQQADTSAHASDARRNDVVRGLNQRPSRKRRARSLADRRGRATITAAAATPPAATTASPMRAPLPAPERATPTEASGARAALSINLGDVDRGRTGSSTPESAAACERADPPPADPRNCPRSADLTASGLHHSA